MPHNPSCLDPHFQELGAGQHTEEGKGRTGPRKGGLGEGGEVTAHGRESAHLPRVHSALGAVEAKPEWGAPCTPGCAA